MTRAPLAGVRVVDVSMALAAPLAGHFLGHFGADVVKVEPPEGDYSRSAGGKGRNDGMNPFTLHTSREKRSIVLDLKQSDGQAALRRLVERADVFLHNFRAPAAQKLGVDWHAISAINPRVVHVHVVGFGSGGPYAGLPAYDDVIQAAVGVPRLMAQMSDGEPMLVPTAWVDRLTGITVYAHIVSALFGRQQDGQGRRIEVPMFETAAHLVLSDHLYMRSYSPPLGPSGHFRLLDRNRKPHRTADGYLCLMPTQDKHWEKIFSLAGRPELIKDERYRNLRSRMQHVGELTALLAEWMVKRTTKEWLQLLREADVPAMPANTLEELLDDEHLREVGFYHESCHPTEGSIVDLPLPGTWSDWDAAPRRPAPRLGEHSREILEELGYDVKQIEAMIDAGVTGSNRRNDQAGAAG